VKKKNSPVQCFVRHVSAGHVNNDSRANAQQRHLARCIHPVALRCCINMSWISTVVVAGIEDLSCHPVGTMFMAWRAEPLAAGTRRVRGHYYRHCVCDKQSENIESPEFL
jgi:hypothetical protein